MTECDKQKMLLTTPPPVTDHRPLYLTGNEYIALPEIGVDAAVHSLNILHMFSCGLLEFAGGASRPLLQPFVSVDGRASAFNNKPAWRYHRSWLPCFTGEVEPGIFIEGKFSAPPGRRGCFFHLALTNKTGAPLAVEAGWLGRWENLNHIIFNRRPVECRRALFFDSWTGSLILEARCGLPLAALALALEPGGKWQVEKDGAGAFRGSTEFRLDPGGSASLTLYLAVNLEADGAGTTAMDLKRHGAAELFKEQDRWLQERRLSLRDPALEETANRNLFFNYFFALGRALDTDDLVPVTSRSPRYYVSAAYWSRDTLLWSFPGLLLADRKIARELLLTIFKRHLKRAGEHAHYINGVLLYPGFELDQLAAHFLALERYEAATGDFSLVAEEIVSRGLDLLVEKADRQYDAETGLYRTFLDPSDDPVLYPFLIYDNALLQRGFSYLAVLQESGRWKHGDDFALRAEGLRRSIYRFGTVKGPSGTMFAWAVDGKGRFQLYDNPPGSLQLLAYYGFCSRQEAVFKNTVSWIRSANNPYFHRGAPFEEAGSLHCNKPWPLAACNDLLAFNTGGEDFFRRAAMDNGFCCETIDPDTGLVSSGAAFASAAGFLAHALYKKQEAGYRKQERHNFPHDPEKPGEETE